MFSEKSALLWLRYVVYATFVICSSILCTVAVYALSLSQNVGREPASTIYLIFLGAVGLVWAIPVLFLDIFTKNPVTGTVWVECVSMGVFWALELSGAAAFSASVPDFMCTHQAESADPHSCSATNTLMAFTWICTVFISSYLLVLVLSALYHHRHSAHVWHANIRTFPWFSAMPSAPSADPEVSRHRRPRSSTLPRQPMSMPTRSRANPAPPVTLPEPAPPALHAPQPRRLTRLRMPVISLRSGRSSERFSRLSGGFHSDHEPLPGPATAPATTAPQLPALLPLEETSPTFYPEHVQLALKAIVWDSPEAPRNREPGPRPRPPPSSRRVTAPGPSTTRPSHAQSPESPEMPSQRPRTASATVSPPRAEMRMQPASAAAGPLGDWPRPDILSQPLRPKKKPPVPPSAFPTVLPAAAASTEDLALAADGARVGSVQASPRSSFNSGRPNGRPTGPRSRQNSTDSTTSRGV